MDTTEQSLTPANETVDAANIETRAKTTIAKFFGMSADEINLSDNIVNDLDADSLDVVELLMEIEEDFEIEIPDEEADKIETVQQVVDYLKAHVKA